ncbi:MAG TPA: hypothetical protein VFK40_09015 [Nitrososphaeraceae archaeon]|nr:hypothetical protein [Nitrososphaeraceae archaeon]
MSFPDRTIKPKLCTYGCNVEIYWNTGKSDYLKLHKKNMSVQAELRKILSSQCFHLYPHLILHNQLVTMRVI